MRVGAGRNAANDADIEITLASAAREALPNDYHLLGILAMWLERHHARANVPRLRRVVLQSNPSTLESAWWSAAAAWLHHQDARWATLRQLYHGPKVSLEGDLDSPE